MTTKIQKWGNSLGLRIPRSAAIEAQIEAGSVVEISAEKGGFRVRAVRGQKFYLKDLLKRIRPGNLHGEISTGVRVGREEW
jgi:antitoxin MazE